MTLAELEGRYESVPTLGPGLRYTLELDGSNAGVEAGERFRLVVAAWSLTGRTVPGTDRPDVQLIGHRQLDGAYRLDGENLVFDVRHLTDTPGDSLGDFPPIRRYMSESIAVEIDRGPKVGLHFKLYGVAVELSRI